MNYQEVGDVIRPRDIEEPRAPAHWRRQGGAGAQAPPIAGQ